MAERRRLDLDALSFRVVVGALSTAAVVVLVAPTVIVLLTSLTASASLRFPPDGLSFRWYRALAGAGQLQRAAGNSLYVAVVATAASAVLGTLGALGIARSRSRWARALDALFMSPLLLPALALAVAALAQLDPALLESSASLGASRLYTFRRVTLPLISRGIAAGAFLAFMASFDNVPVSLFLSDARTEVLPIHLWQIIETNLDVRAAAASGVLIVFTLLVMLLGERLAGLSRQLR